ncbi:MAG TPA: Rpn family recombination-promoting nuclease/putative transposase [Thermoanaerobaculia bacterium]|jgi:hypothetical protein|nr:Rpn family recombination-promoting nuclease/putative transposase [Thermoanaerobaculia bacterium]
MARRKDKAPGHDLGYKRLFSQPSLVEGLLRGFLHESWIDQLDFSTLEKVGNSFVSEDLRERHSDVIWRLRLRGDGETWVYLYLLLELQSTSDPFMAVRLLTYIGLLLEEIIRKEKLKPGDRLPAVFPLVLYNGKGRWRAPLRLESLFVPVPSPLKRYLPRLTYRLLDEHRLELDCPELEQNRTAALFRIETNEAPEDLPGLSRTLDHLLPSGDSELRRTVHAWFTVVARRRFPDAIIPEGVSLKESPMLEETLVKWHDQIVRETRQEEDLAVRRQVLLELLIARFGRLPQTVRNQVKQITSIQELKKLSRRVLKAKSLQEMGLS